MPADAQRMETLDGMRGIAALLVVCYHVNSVWVVAPGGYLAVDFFFLLSGLVIARTYDARLRSGLGLAPFARIRFIRVYPLFALGLALATVRAIGQTAMHSPSSLSPARLGESLLLEVFMLPSPANEHLFPLNGPGWSLFLELLVNFVYAALAPRLTVRALKAVVVVAAVVLAATGLSQGSLVGGAVWPTVFVGVARVAFSFSLGVLVHRIGLVPGQRRSAWFWAPVALLVAVLVAPVPVSWRAVYDLAAVLFVFPLVLLAGARLAPTASARSAATLLGEVSYPVYVLHYPLLFVCLYATAKARVAPQVWVPIFVLGIAALAWAAGRWYDQPVRRWLASLAGPKHTTATA